MKKKYIIDLNPDCVEGEYLRIPARIAGEEQWLVTKAALTPYTEPDLEQVRKEGYKEGREAGIKDGKCEAWEAARKIIHMPEGDLLELFDVYSSVCTPVQVMLKYDASECIEKIRQYEQKQKEERIQVGDEVRNIEGGWIAVVSNIDGECMTLMDTNGALGDGYDVNRFTKTGRHFPEIAAVLEKMRGEQDG